VKLTELPANCLPSRVLEDDVYLIDAGGDRLADPLYQISLERLCEQGNPLRIRLPLDTLASITEREGLPGPRGLIVHTGRCGSTLLGNMLGAHPAVRMIKEAEALNQILLDRGSTAAVTAVLRAFGRGLPPGSAVVVKCTTWNILELRRMLVTFPDASAVFLWRPAAEVVASCLDVPPPWVRWRDDPGLCGTWYPGAPADLTDLAAFYGHAWRVTAAAALDAAAEFGDRMKFISYAELRADPRRIATASARHFALPVTPDLAACMTRHADRYSKNPSVRFDPAGAHARRQLTAAQNVVVERMTGRLEAGLASRGG
jgi:hypothetical protein